MDERIEQLRERYLLLECLFIDIERIVEYLNREIGVEKLPDKIRNREDAINEIESWNEMVKEAILLQRKYQEEGVISDRQNFFEKFLVKLK